MVLEVRRACAVTAVVFALAGALAIAAKRDARQSLAPPPAATAPPAMQGTGTIALTVVSEATGRPVKGANVTAIISTGEATYVRDTLTDARGRALLLGLAKGRVRLTATHQSFLTHIYGQDRSGETSGTFIPLDDNQHLENITLRMIRGGAIGGTVTDEAGDPVVGVQVRAFRREFANGKPQFTPFASFDQTDDRGAYRIAQLTPGDYIIGVVPRYLETEEPAATEPTPGSPAEAEPGVAPGFLAPGVARTIADFATHSIAIAQGRVVQFAQWSPPPVIESLDGAARAYPPTFYPGTTTAAAAFVIRLGPAEQRDGAMIRLESVQVTRISGRVVDSLGNPPARVELALMPAGVDERILIGDTLGTVVAPNGTFGISFVPAGQYTIDARGNAAASDPSRPPLTHPLWASVPITVDGTPQSEIVIKLEEGSVFSGRVVIDGGRPTTLQSVSRLQILLLPRATATAMALPVASIGVGEDLRFRLAQLMPGDYVVSMRGLPQDWRLASAIVDGRETLDFGMKIRPHQEIETAIFTISNKLCELTGVARDAAGRSSTRGTIVLFPADASLWTPETSRLQAVRPDTDGQFVFRFVRPGSYLLAAADPEPGQWRDPAFLETLRARATTVLLRPGEKTLQDVK